MMIPSCKEIEAETVVDVKLPSEDVLRWWRRAPCDSRGDCGYLDFGTMTLSVPGNAEGCLNWGERGLAERDTSFGGTGGGIGEAVRWL